MLHTISRRLTLDGAHNVRDIGGYATVDGRQTRWNVLLRADNLHRISAADSALLRDYGLRTVIDLRRPTELAAAPNRLAQTSGIAYHHISLVGERVLDSAPPQLPESLLDIYLHIVDERQDVVAAALRTLTAPGAFPALVHCTAGKDRTGVLVALLLALAGVPADTIAADYALTAEYLGDAYFADARQRAAAAGFDWTAYQHLLICPPEFMHALLDHLGNRYGSVLDYVRTIGLSEADVTTLRNALVEPPVA